MTHRDVIGFVDLHPKRCVRQCTKALNLLCTSYDINIHLGHVHVHVINVNVYSFIH